MATGPARAHWIVVGALLALQAWNACQQLPPAAVFSGEPFFADDYILHYARAQSVAPVLAETGRLWTYDPGHMAGYPLGAAVFDLDNQGMAVLFALLPIDDPIVFNVVVWLCYALAPLAIALATRAMGLSPAASAGAAAASVFVSTVTPNFQYGMFAGFAASWLAVLVVVLAERQLAAPSLGRFVAIVGVGGLGVFFHALVALLVLVPCSVLVIAHARRDPRAALLRAGAILLGVLALNLAWVVPFLRFAGPLGWDYPHPFFRTGPWWWVVRNFVLPFAGWHVLLLALGVAGLLLARQVASPLRIAWAAWTALLLLVCTRGSSIPVLERIEPANMVLPLEFALCPFAGHVAATLVDRLAARTAPVRAAWARPALAALLFAPYLVWQVAFVAAREPLAARLPDEALALERWLRDRTAPKARLMIEDRLHVERPPLDADVPSHPYLAGHFLALLPQRIGRELIGGPYAEAPIAPHRADFASGRAFGRRIERWRPAALARLLEHYNVGWIVAWSAPARKYLDAQPRLARAEGRHGTFHLYRVLRRHDFFERGSGRVRAEIDAIRVTDASPGGVVLRYHAYPGLCSDPALPVTAWERPGLAAPFVAVENGSVRDFVLRPRGWPGGCD